MSSQSQAQPKSIIIRPYHRRNSDRMLESTKNSANPIYLDAPEKLVIAERSFCLERAEGYTDENKVYVLDEFGFPKRTDIRWFDGCKSIKVEDQDKTNPNYQILLQDRIFIHNGFLEVVDTAKDHWLFEYLSKHNDNISNPDRVVPPQGEDITAFEVINYKKDASQQITKIEEQEQAFDVLNNVKTGTGATRKFNEGELNKLKVIFGIQKETNEEVYIALKGLAQFDPAAFLAKIEQQRYIVAYDFQSAKDAGAVTYNPKDKTYSINNEVVFTATAKTAPKQDSEFIDFMTREEGFIAYSDMRTQRDLILTQSK